MPSYRVTIGVGALAPAVRPEAVLPTAAALAAERTVVEAQDVQLVRGEPRIVVRYEAEDDGVATAVAGHVVGGLAPVAQVVSDRVTRRDGGRWVAVADARTPVGLEARPPSPAHAPARPAPPPRPAPHPAPHPAPQHRE